MPDDPTQPAPLDATRDPGDLLASSPPRSPMVPRGASEALVPERIGHYRVEGLIARGGFGSVYRARHVWLGYTGAIKVLRTPHSGDERGFRAEAQRLATLLGHPGVVQIRDFGLYRDPASGQRFPYFVTDHVPGEQSITHHADATRADLRERLRLMAMVCDGVQHAHDHGLLHLDLKPGNILVWPGMPTRPAQPKLIDLGIARAIDPAADPSPSGFRGTPHYMAPEQTMPGSTLDERTDVHALGVVLYELLLGRLPYALPRDADRGSLAEIIRTAPPDLDSPEARRLPAPVRAILERALEKPPERRYESARAMGDDLRRVLQGMLPAGAGAARRAGHSIRQRLASSPLLGFVLALTLGTLAAWGLGVPLFYTWTDASARFERSLTPMLAPNHLDRVAVLDVHLDDARRVLGLPADAPIEPWQRRALLARVLNAWCDAGSARARPAAIAIDLAFRGPRPPDEDLARALSRTTKELAPVVLGMSDWEFGPDGAPAASVLSPALARASDRLGHLRMQNPVANGKVYDWQMIVLEEQTSAEPAPALALAAIAASIAPASKAQYELSATGQEVLLRFYDSTPGGVRRYTSPDPVMLPVTTSFRAHPTPAEPSPRRDSARLILPIPARSVLDRVTVDASRVLAGEAGAIEMLARRIVIVSDTSDAKDYWPAPTGERLPGCFAHALTAEALRGSVLQRPGQLGRQIVLVGGAALGAAIPLLVHRRRPYAHRRVLGISSLAWLAGVAAIVVATMLAGMLWGYLVNPMLPLLGMGVAGAVSLGIQYLARSPLTALEEVPR